jgi:hypothetical protein
LFEAACRSDLEGIVCKWRLAPRLTWPAWSIGASPPLYRREQPLLVFCAEVGEEVKQRPPDCRRAEGRRADGLDVIQEMTCGE